MFVELQSEFLYATLILPSLFALTLIAEGTVKVFKYGTGWVAIGTGTTFLLIVVAAYIFLLIQ